MKHIHADIGRSFFDELHTAVYGAPRGDELPQVAGVNDILMDVYSDILNMPREYAAGHFHHQYVDDFEASDTIIH
jgi:hypothetical protein